EVGQVRQGCLSERFSGPGAESAQVRPVSADRLGRPVMDPEVDEVVVGGGLGHAEGLGSAGKREIIHKYEVQGAYLTNAREAIFSCINSAQLCSKTPDMLSWLSVLLLYFFVCPINHPGSTGSLKSPDPSRRRMPRPSSTARLSSDCSVSVADSPSP